MEMIREKREEDGGQQQQQQQTINKINTKIWSHKTHYFYVYIMFRYIEFMIFVVDFDHSLFPKT